MSVRGLRDEFEDVLIEVGARRGRLVLLIVAIALSVGVLVAALSTSGMAARQIDADVAASASNSFSVSLRESSDGGNGASFPPDTDDRAARVPLVAAAGRRVDLPTADVTVRRLPYRASSEGRPEAIAIAAVTSGYLQAAGITTDTPTAFLLDVAKPYPVALVGPSAARTLGLPDHGPYLDLRIWIGDRAFSVLGRLNGASSVGLDSAVVVPLTLAESLAPVTPIDTTVLVRTDVGAGAPVARVIRVAIRPEAPDSLVVSSVSDFSRLRVGVSDQLARLSAGVGALLLVLGMLLIANAMVVSVISRTGEIGLRRSLGAPRSSVARIFLIEGALAGSLGGLAGAALGVWSGLVVAMLNGWSFRFPITLAFLGPLLGTVVAVVASAYPAWRAASIQPADALRSE